MAKLTFSHLFLLVLVVSVSVVSLWAGEEEANEMCSVQLDPNKCDLSTCQRECLEKYKGVGQCAHFVTQLHCICIYICPPYY